MTFLKKLNDWMDKSNLSECEKDCFIGYAIKAAFARQPIEELIDENVLNLYSKIQNMETFRELIQIIDESFNPNTEPEIEGTTEEH